jgi:signal transduction histidine kinase
LSEVSTTGTIQKDPGRNQESAQREERAAEASTSSIPSFEKTESKQSDGFQSFVTAHHVSFSVTLSFLLAASGVLFVLTSLSYLSFFSFLGISISLTSIRIFFGVIGVFLLISPLFLNRFVLDALRHERNLRIRAEKSTREAQLLQDILTHDVRNYNQVSKLSAELLADEFKMVPDAQILVDRLLESIDGSTLLVQRAKMLGKVISDHDLKRQPISLIGSLKRSMKLILSAYPDVKVNVAVKLPSMPLGPLDQLNQETVSAYVLADDLLDEVFLNLFSNSVKYSESEEVFIGIELNHEFDRELKRDAWRIAISDAGKGIPDDLKRSLFSRYLDGAKGSGLGMSIVHALVVGRYAGRIEVTDRVRNSHSKGTLIELLLPAGS